MKKGKSTKKPHEFHSRSLAKALTWRVIATLTTVILVFVATGNLELAGKVGVFDVLLKLFFYYAHERVWGKVNWGKERIK